MSLQVYRPDGSYMGQTISISPFSNGASGARGVLTREEFASRKTRKSRDYDFQVDPFATYEAYLASQSPAQGYVAKPQSPGRAQPIQPPSQGNRLGEAPLGSSEVSGYQKTSVVAADEQRPWRWDGNQIVFTTDEEEKARQRNAVITELEKQRADAEKRKRAAQNQKPINVGPYSPAKQPSSPHPDFDPPPMGSSQFQVITKWHKPETGEEVSMPNPGYTPRQGTGWLPGPLPRKDPVGMAQPIPEPSTGTPL